MPACPAMREGSNLACLWVHRAARPPPPSDPQVALRRPCLERVALQWSRDCTNQLRIRSDVAQMVEFDLYPVQFAAIVIQFNLAVCLSRFEIYSNLSIVL